MDEQSWPLFADEGIFFRILTFCERTTSSDFIFLSKWHKDTLTSEASFKWRLHRLHIEKGIYCPPRLPPNSTWKTLYLELVKRQFLWEKTSSVPTAHKFNINVSARFKPKGLSRGAEHTKGNYEKKLNLPLHQRLALIRLDKKVSSNKEALKILGNQGGWFREKWAEIEEEKKDQDESPLDSPEKSKNSSPGISGGVHFIDTENNCVILVDPTKGLREFQFDNIMDGSKSQEYAYDSSTMPLVIDFFNGFNATCLVYGQTGSGKTHTMFGPGGGYFGDERAEKQEDWGIVPRVCSEVFEAIEFRKKHLNIGIEATVTASYIEVYGNEVIDLLKNGAQCGQSRVAAQRYVLDGSAEVPVSSLRDSLKLLNRGSKQKRTAATAMNERSSRAHTLFILTLRQKCVESGVSATSRLFLADLGGSEQVKKSLPLGRSLRFGETEENGSLPTASGSSDKDRLREAVNINLGLLALKNCVEALNSRRPRAHIPYSDDKLTMMLSSGLGGDSKTSVVVCAAQEEEHGAETISAMKFGHSCGKVSNTTISKANMLKGLLTQIDEKIAKCEENIKKHERWETRQERRVDRLDCVDLRYTTVLVGAENYRQELEDLLYKRAELTGAR
mmetsp:Transcript_12698/g.17497  ORF Transcript_12698/g.17497 Transcript_12698/m.17497 type:complete len:616 (-) Transcript_12698:187-2034(-)|eukprot:CAMPEP_0185723608 /NCGR_PEP_ID=MMETSP1171-20130828/396_1 /TAXON_ID=374046 /ORGANISM="Helicotheca tamensis, Strain CCMP826" /LENGTH=615 /DNA_ID=CAMNT_0028391341 /DNA_START=154 /DNA_END=2001 /DNA_ORIENTATION=-